MSDDHSRPSSAMQTCRAVIRHPALKRTLGGGHSLSPAWTPTYDTPLVRRSETRVGALTLGCIIKVTNRTSGGSRGNPTGKSHVSRNVPPLYGQFSTSGGACTVISDTGNPPEVAHLQNNLEERHITVVEIHINMGMRVGKDRFDLPTGNGEQERPCPRDYDLPLALSSSCGRRHRCQPSRQSWQRT